MDRRLIAAAVVPFLLTGCAQTENAVDMRDEWNTNYFLTPTYNPKHVQAATELAQINAAAGTVHLGDQTSWLVRGEDRKAAARWRPSDRVIVVASDHVDWPYTIINLDTHDAQGLRARPGQ